MISDIPHQLFTFLGLISGTLEKSWRTQYFNQEQRNQEPELREAYMNSHLANVSVL
jgi:hypothetical protein